MDQPSLHDLLCAYSRRAVAPLHMPGHKRQSLHSAGLPWAMDITEIDGFDNLHAPEGVLQASQERAARLWGSEDAYFLVNGSTGGLLAGIYAAVGLGGKILVARNCHKAVYHAIEVLSLSPVYITPPMIAGTQLYGSITPQQVEAALSVHPDVQLAVITSPTYEGVCSDVGAIATVLHRFGIPLFVDEAHGAHLGLSGGFPSGAIAAGADLVVQSLHKTLPSLTQTAILHRQGGLVLRERVRHALGVFQSSSPSYPMLAGIDGCVRLLEAKGTELLCRWRGQLSAFYEKAESFSHLRLLTAQQDPLQVHAHDPSKLTVLTSGTTLSGVSLMRTLREEYGIELEMALDGYAVAMTGLATMEADLSRLLEGLTRLDQGATLAPHQVPVSLPPMPEQVTPAGRALLLPGAQVPLSDSVGRVSRTYLWAYPPGIPIVTPGVCMDQAVVSCIEQLLERGVTLKGTFSTACGEIEVVDNGCDIG